MTDRALIKAMLARADDLISAIEGTTDQFEDEVSALADAVSAVEKEMSPPPAGFTPEPWRLDHPETTPEQGTILRYLIGGDNELIADLWADTPDINLALPQDVNANGALLVRAPQMLAQLERAFTVLDRISDTLHYEDGEPVTALEARDIEIIFDDARCELAAIDTLIRSARRPS